MAGKRGRRRPRPEIQGWELELVRKIAGAAGSPDSQELEAELLVTLLELKLKHPPGIRDWPAYLIKVLNNRAERLMGIWQARERKQALLRLLHARGGLDPSLEALLGSPDTDPAEKVALGRALQELDPELRELWDALVEQRGYNAKAARRVGKHRNTVLLWLRRIRKLLKEHGFGP